MSLRTFVAPLFCAASLLGALSGCSDDSGDLTGVGGGQGSDAGKSRSDAGVTDAGKGKDAGRDAKVNPPDPEPDSSMDMGCGSVRAAAQLERGPVDIVLALDTSGSMADEICNVSNNLTLLAGGVGDTAHFVSVYQMGILGLETAVLCGNADPLAATPLAMDPTRYLNLPVNVDSWAALSDLVNNYDGYKDFLRPDAPTNFIVVSDDESKPLQGGMLAADFKTQMEAKLGHPFIFHAIVADGQNNCRGSSIGQQYLDLADATGGEKLSICATDWSVVFKQLQAAVASSAPIPCDFDIPESPAGGTLDTEAVQVVYTPIGESEVQFPRAKTADKCGDQTAWYYNDEANPTKVELCPAACDAVKAGGDVDIAFGCAPIFAL